MTSPDHDPELAERFAALRREDEAQVPPFERIVERAARPKPRDLRRPLWGLAAAAAGLVLLALAAWWTTREWRRPAPPPGPSLLEWRSPTDFLLATPGWDSLSTVPRLGHGLPVFEPATSLERKSS